MKGWKNAMYVPTIFPWAKFVGFIDKQILFPMVLCYELPHFKAEHRWQNNALTSSKWLNKFQKPVMHWLKRVLGEILFSQLFWRCQCWQQLQNNHLIVCEGSRRTCVHSTIRAERYSSGLTLLHVYQDKSIDTDKVVWEFCARPWHYILECHANTALSLSS